MNTVASTPEGKVKADIKTLLKQLPNCWWFMPVSTGHGVHGIPDFIVCYCGFFVAIEAKKPGGKAGTTPLQKMQIRGIEMAHGRAIVADNVEEVRQLFADMAAAVARQGLAV